MKTSEKMPRVKWLDEACHVCGGRTNRWDARICKALQYKHITCEKCIAKEYDKTTDELRDTMEDFFGMRPCKGI